MDESNSNECGLRQGTDKAWLMNSPLFGRCRLVPHSIEEAPTKAALGYVELEGQPEKAVVAINLDGEWRDRNNRPFSRKVVQWFDIVKESDGQTII